MTVSAEDGFDRVTFSFEPGSTDSPADESGLIVRPVGVPPAGSADGRPLGLRSAYHIEVRFRDMELDRPDGSVAFGGPRDMARQGIVERIVEIQDSSLVQDWLIGSSSECARVWQDGTERLIVDLQR